MAYTYDPAALDEGLNEVRFLIGDTGPNFRLTDEEIAAYLPGGALEEATTQATTIALCYALAARYAGVVDVSEGGASFSGSQLSAQYEALAKRLEKRGGISVSAIAGGSAFPANSIPAFTRIMGDPDWVQVETTAEDYQ